ncbi:MAG: sugar transferase [Anaerolineae bacterium]|nr:sugar transferase [Anaerolineae bacterium]
MSHRKTTRTIRTFTILSDILLINLAFAWAYVVRYELQWFLPIQSKDPYAAFIVQQVVLNLILIFTFSQSHVWQRRRGDFWLDEVVGLIYPTFIGISLMMAYTFLDRPLANSRGLLVWATLFIFLFLSLSRWIRRLIMGRLYRRGIGVDQALIIGEGEPGRSLIRTLLARPDLGYQTIGYLDAGLEQNNIGSGRIPHLGTWTDLSAIVEKNPQLRTLFIALPVGMTQQTSKLIRQGKSLGLRVQVIPDMFQLSLNQVESSSMGGIPVLSVREVEINRAGQVVKRILDLVLVAIGAIPVLLLSGLIALAIKWESPGPVLFFQERVGQHGKLFKMIKFRSMIVNADDQKAALLAMNEASGPIFKIREDPRLTRTGKILRRLSLDELPQLYNIMLGNMTLVGPRPPLPDEVAQYQPWHKQRLEVKGGLTGLWQVSGRSDLTFDEQCLLDIYYIENWSLALDIRIILHSIPYILFGRGAY